MTTEKLCTKIKELVGHLTGILRVMYTIDCWSRLGETNKEWDKLCRGFLEDENVSIKVIDKFTVTINGFEVWYSNHPYASMHIHDYSNPVVKRALPSRITALRMMDMIKKHANHVINPDKEQAFRDYLEKRTIDKLRGSIK